MKRHAIGLMLAATIGAGGAQAAAPSGPRWMAAGTAPDGGAIEVNAAAIVTMGALTRGWWRVRFREPRPDGTAIETRLYAVDCAQRLTTTLETIATTLDGRVLSDGRESESAALTRLSPATPGTAGEAAGRAICAMGRRRPAG
jgi:hypothetical protein